MHRRASLAFGAALAFVAGLPVAACGTGEASDSTGNAAPETSEVIPAAQTTPATQPVVTVYKSPT